MPTARFSSAKDQQIIVVCDSASIATGDISQVLSTVQTPHWGNPKAQEIGWIIGRHKKILKKLSFGVSIEPKCGIHLSTRVSSLK